MLNGVMTNSEKIINELFDELVPADGMADTVAGEIVRAVSRIGYRFYNDGDKIGVGYGNETCNPAARYLLQTIDRPEIHKVISEMWGWYNEGNYEAHLNKLNSLIVEHLNDNPSLFEQKNTVDMWSLFDPDEDREDYDDEWEEEEEYEDDEWE